MADIYTPPDPNTEYEYWKGHTCQGFQLIHKWILITGKHPELVGKIHELIEADPAVVNLKLKNGMTPLHLVCSDVGELDRVAMAKLLLGKGANVDAKDEHQRTPLHRAAIYGYADMAKVLLEKGANVNAKDGYQQTPLFWAATFGHADVTKLLLENGANASLVGENKIISKALLSIENDKKTNIKLQDLGKCITHDLEVNHVNIPSKNLVIEI